MNTTSKPSSGWNRSTSTPKPAPKKPSALRGVVAGLVVVVLALAGAWYFLRGDSSVAERQGKDRGLIKEATPTKAPTPSAKPPTTKKMRVKPKTLEDALANVSERMRPLEIKKAAKPINLDGYTNRVFNSTTEQMMSWIFTTRVGEMPLPMPGIPDDERKNLAAILISKNEIKPEDSEGLALAKESVDQAKKEMIEYIKQGGDPEEFLDYYNKELERIYLYRCDARSEYVKLQEEDPELAEAFRDKVNQGLAEKGATPIEKQYLTLEEALEAEENESKDADLSQHQQ